MSDVDVRALAGEQLAAGEFPASGQADFRLYLAPAVHQGIQDHAKADASVEICGVLVGLWKRDADGPFAEATDYIRCGAAESKFAEVTFTHESWAQINEQMDTAYDDKRILGWYHSHPDFGIFLSDRDVFIHEHFFSGPGQVAYVVDPVRDLEGAFAWRAGKPTLLPHYWVGDAIVTSQQSERGQRTEGGTSAAAAAAAMTEHYAQQAADRGDTRLFGSMTTALACLSLFLLGYLLAGWRNRSEQAMLAEGALAHYGRYQIAHLGLRGHLDTVRQNLGQLREAVVDLPEPGAELSADDAKSARRQRTQIANGLRKVADAVDSISSKYGFSPQEEAYMAALMSKIRGELDSPPGKTEAKPGVKPSAPPETTRANGGRDAMPPSAPRPAQGESGIEDANAAATDADTSSNGPGVDAPPSSGSSVAEEGDGA